ncbi:MAG: DNA-processing protein DprA [Clostridioides sp.]|jgi:DNA processing protein|nr:DNA-processing protein DprA [Clostridioides sp.]
MDKRDTYLMLKSVAKLSNKAIDDLNDSLQNLEDLYDLSDDEILNLEKLNLNIKKIIVKYRGRTYLDEVKESLYRKSVKFLCCEDELYPQKLKNICDNPKVIFYKGNIENLNTGLNIAMVGSRKPTYYGVNTAKKIARDLSNSGVGIVSGLAIGIDAFSHIGCLEGASKTIAVLGSGVDDILPRQNAKLAERILDDGGLIISEFGVDSKVFPSNFSMRNRIISGVSDGVLVVEAAGKSGALITVECALDQGRNVFAVPGNITSNMSRGCNRMIKDGAKLCEDIDDILEEYGIKVQTDAHNSKNADLESLNLSDEEKIILSTIDIRGSMHIDDICDKTNIDIKTVNTVLNKLLLMDIVIEWKNKTYSLNK